MRLRTILFTSLALLLSGLIWSLNSNLPAQDSATETTTDTTPADDDSHRRLPAYYNDLVTPGQRARIYQIQDEYETQIEQLKQQLREVVSQRDAEVEAVLEPEQRELLTEVKEQSRRLREARAKAAARLRERLPEEESDESLGNE